MHTHPSSELTVATALTTGAPIAKKIASIDECMIVAELICINGCKKVVKRSSV